MCSLNEIEQASDGLRSKKGSKRREKRNCKNFAGEGSCMKCPEKAVVLVRNNDPFCKSCFLDYVVHKFRATIGKARVIHQGQRVLLAVSGGPSSCAMLDLVIKGLSKNAVKKHRFQPGVVHIDDGGLSCLNLEERNLMRHHIEELARSVGFPCHHASLSDMFETSRQGSLEVDSSSGVSKSQNSLSKLFEGVTTMTAQEDLLSHLYRNLLQKVAKDHGYDYIMVGECSTDLAIRILADVAQGRGSQLPFSVGFKDDRTEVMVLRPMREFTKKEIQFYNSFNDLTSFTIPSFSTKASSHASVNRLTEELIFGLQTSFPSTVNTVLKTGDKLSSNIDSETNRHCALCLAPMDICVGCTEVVSELTTCGGGECGSGCQNADDNGGTDGGGNCGDGNSGDGSTLRGTHSTLMSMCGTLEGANGDGGYSGALRVTHSSDGGTTYPVDSGTDGAGGTSRSITHSAGHHGTLRTTSGSDGHGGTRRITGGDGTDHSDSGSEADLSRLLCYGCQLTYSDMKDGQLLLDKFVTEISRIMKSSSQKTKEGTED